MPTVQKREIKLSRGKRCERCAKLIPSGHSAIFDPRTGKIYHPSHAP